MNKVVEEPTDLLNICVNELVFVKCKGGYELKGKLHVILFINILLYTIYQNLL